MNAFVTGGSRGIGRSIVLKLATEGFGCAFTFRGNETSANETLDLARAAGREDARFYAYQLDQSDPGAIESVVDRAIDEFEDIGVLVNNAAVVRNNAAAIMTNEEWEEVIATNLSGPFYLSRSFIMHFLSNRFGRIINISSLAQDGAIGQVNYAASKAGLVGMTKTLAREYGVKGITTNVVTVGLVETDMVKDAMAEQLKDIWLSYCPMKRMGSAEEIASAVHYLTLPNSGFINGEVLRIAGGLTYVP